MIKGSFDLWRLGWLSPKSFTAISVKHQASTSKLLHVTLQKPYSRVTIPQNMTKEDKVTSIKAEMTRPTSELEQDEFGKPSNENYGEDFYPVLSRDFNTIAQILAHLWFLDINTRFIITTVLYLLRHF